MAIFAPFEQCLIAGELLCRRAEVEIEQLHARVISLASVGWIRFNLVRFFSVGSGNLLK
jgi:hypothetical protein